MSATYYLSADVGNDTTGTGTSALPWATIAKFIASSSVTDTCMLQKSTAHYLWANATISNRTLVGVTNNPLDAVIDAGGSNPTYTMGDPVAFSGIRFTNLVKTAASYVFNLTAGTQLHCTFTNCQLDNIQFWPVNANSDGCWGGLNGASMILTLTNCLIYDVVQAAGSTSGGSMFSGTGGSGVGSVDFEHTTLYIPSGSKMGQVIRIDYNTGTGLNITLKNFIVQNLDTGINFFNTTNQGGVTCNASYSCLNGTNMTSGVTLGTGVITTDPLFIDPTTNFNFNLQASSPCIGAGTI